MPTSPRLALRWIGIRARHALWIWNGRPIQRWMSVDVEIEMMDGELLEETWRCTARRAEALLGTTPIQDVDDLFAARCARAFEDGLSYSDAAAPGHAIREIRLRRSHLGYWRLPLEYLVLQDMSLVKVDLHQGLGDPHAG